MEFLVTKTSVWDDKESPCEEAYFKKYISVDERTVADPKEIPIHGGTNGGWYDRGANHRVVNGHICRDFEDEGWFVDIDDILEFSEKYGNLIISKESYSNRDIPSIEIYDDYRE